jgi:hypothetical protein
MGLRKILSSRSDKSMNGFHELAGSEIRKIVEKGEMVIYRHLKDYGKMGASL